MSYKSSVSKIPAEFSLNSISHQSTKAYFKGRAYSKIILKNHARFSYRGNTVANTARFLRFASSQTLRNLAFERIANFGIALAKHCNPVLCSFVLEIDWLKPFLTEQL